MLQFSHDPEARTIYCYLTELEEGQAAYVLEYPAALALDPQGQLIGLCIELDDEVTLNQLELALELPGCRLDMDTGRLWLLIADEEPAELVALADSAILDLDGDEVVLGVEVVAPQELCTPERLARLAPLMVVLDDVGQGGEGPVVFQEPLIASQQAEEEAPPEQPTVEEPPPDAPPTAELRSGFVAIVGKPNVGKSTLLNALLGQKVAIVSPRPQTTRVPLRGILTRPEGQIVFIDTPGIHDPRHRLGQFMVDLARKSLPGADLICFMVDISQPPSALDVQIAAQVQRMRVPKLLVLNKVDLRPRQQESYLEDYRALGDWAMELAISAQRRIGLDGLVEELLKRLPFGPAHYPDEQVTDQSEQQLVAELVREKVLLFTQQEVPHSVAVEVEEWQEKDAATYIRLTINVEKESQKGILIGAGGTMLKRIGTSARADIERMLRRPAFVDLWVKVRENWRDDPSALTWLGYRAKDWT
jgi:GTP-binding protein Era